MTTYRTGTVSIGANATSLSGTGTAWSSSGVRPGDMLLLAGNIVPIASVNSNTGITLARPWPGAAQSGANYDILLIDDDVRTLVAANLLLQQLTNGTLTSLAGLTSAANKMPYFSGANVMALADLTAEARSLLASTLLSRSGNNLVTPSNARLTGGVVTESPTDTTPNRLLKVGDGGFLQASTVNGILVTDANDATTSGSFRTTAETLNLPISSQQFGILDVRTGHSSGTVHQYWSPNYAGGTSNIMALYARKRQGASGAWTEWTRFLTSQNTTVDSNGFVKAASPILRLFGDGRIEEPVQPTGAEIARVSAGLYQISSTLGLAQEGWQIEVPRDHNGNILCHVATAWAAGVLTVTVSEPLWDNGCWVAGDPIDVPAGRWIDIRLHEESADVA